MQAPDDEDAAPAWLLLEARGMHRFLALIVMLASTSAFADDLPVAPPTDTTPVTAEATSPTEPTPQLSASLAQPPRDEVPPAEAARMERARFSGKRFVVESLVGGLAGGLASYGVFKGLCSEGGCLGGSLAAMGANLVVTPLTAYGIGRAMGGQGTLLWSYYGIAVAGVALADQGDYDETPQETIDRVNLQLTIFSILLPFASAACFELSSHIAYSRWMSAHQAKIQVTPVGTTGAVASFSMTL